MRVNMAMAKVMIQRQGMAEKARVAQKAEAILLGIRYSFWLMAIRFSGNVDVIEAFEMVGWCPVQVAFEEWVGRI